MSLIIIGKIGFAALGTAAVSIGGIALAKLFTPTTVEIYGIVAVAETNGSSGKKLKCQIDQKTKFDCAVKEDVALTSSSKNHVALETLLDEKNWTNIAGKLEAKKIYKITISSTDFATHESDLKTQPIKITEESDETKPTEFGSITTVLMIKDAEKTWLGTTKYFVGQASEAINPIDGYQCSWVDQDAKESLKACSIFPFVSGDESAGQGVTYSKISDLTFTQTATPSTATKKDHYYLITFTSDDSKELKDFSETDLIYAKDSTTPGTEKITFSIISAVAVVGDQLLILKQQAGA